MSDKFRHIFGNKLINYYLLFTIYLLKNNAITNAKKIKFPGEWIVLLNRSCQHR